MLCVLIARSFFIPEEHFTTWAGRHSPHPFCSNGFIKIQLPISLVYPEWAASRLSACAQNWAVQVPPAPLAEPCHHTRRNPHMVAVLPCPSQAWPPLSALSLWIFPFWTFHTNEGIQYIAFGRHGPFFKI